MFDANDYFKRCLSYLVNIIIWAWHYRQGNYYDQTTVTIVQQQRSCASQTLANLFHQKKTVNYGRKHQNLILKWQYLVKVTHFLRYTLKKVSNFLQHKIRKLHSKSINCNRNCPITPLWREQIWICLNKRFCVKVVRIRTSTKNFTCVLSEKVTAKKSCTQSGEAFGGWLNAGVD